jgi:hypothetical protein
VADINRYLAATIDDYLLSLAEGVHSAQRRLDQTSVGSGGSNWTYHLPQVDFELKMTIEMVESTTLANRYKPQGFRALANQHLMLRPLAPEELSSGQVQAEVASVIRGSFVASPAQAGQAALLLRSAIEQLAPQRVEFSVLVQDATFAVKPDLEVHFNIDQELSLAANTERGRPAALLAETFLSSGVVVTDAQGVAKTELHIANNQVPGTVVVVSLDVAGRSELVYYEYEAG